MERLGTMQTIGEVGVAVNQSRQYRERRKIDDFCPGRNGQPFAHSLYLAIANDDRLIR